MLQLRNTHRQRALRPAPGRRSSVVCVCKCVCMCVRGGFRRRATALAAATTGGGGRGARSRLQTRADRCTPVGPVTSRTIPSPFPSPHTLNTQHKHPPPPSNKICQRKKTKRVDRTSRQARRQAGRPSERPPAQSPNQNGLLSQSRSLHPIGKARQQADSRSLPGPRVRPGPGQAYEGRGGRGEGPSFRRRCSIGPPPRKRPAAPLAAARNAGTLAAKGREPGAARACPAAVVVGEGVGVDRCVQRQPGPPSQCPVFNVQPPAAACASNGPGSLERALQMDGCTSVPRTCACVGLCVGLCVALHRLNLTSGSLLDRFLAFSLC